MMDTEMDDPVAFRPTPMSPNSFTRAAVAVAPSSPLSPHPMSPAESRSASPHGQPSAHSGSLSMKDKSTHANSGSSAKSPSVGAEKQTPSPVPTALARTEVRPPAGLGQGAGERSTSSSSSCIPHQPSFSSTPPRSTSASNSAAAAVPHVPHASSSSSDTDSDSESPDLAAAGSAGRSRRGGKKRRKLQQKESLPDLVAFREYESNFIKSGALEALMQWRRAPKKVSLESMIAGGEKSIVLFKSNAFLRTAFLIVHSALLEDLTECDPEKKEELELAFDSPSTDKKELAKKLVSCVNMRQTQITKLVRKQYDEDPTVGSRPNSFKAIFAVDLYSALASADLPQLMQAMLFMTIPVLKTLHKLWFTDNLSLTVRFYLAVECMDMDHKECSAAVARIAPDLKKLRAELFIDWGTCADFIDRMYTKFSPRKFQSNLLTERSADSCGARGGGGGGGSDLDDESTSLKRKREDADSSSKKTDQLQSPAKKSKAVEKLKGVHELEKKQLQAQIAALVAEIQQLRKTPRPAAGATESGVSLSTNQSASKNAQPLHADAASEVARPSDGKSLWLLSGSEKIIANGSRATVGTAIFFDAAASKRVYTECVFKLLHSTDGDWMEGVRSVAAEATVCEIISRSPTKYFPLPYGEARLNFLPKWNASMNVPRKPKKRGAPPSTEATPLPVLSAFVSEQIYGSTLYETFSTAAAELSGLTGVNSTARWAVCVELIRAVRQLHSLGIIHRDLHSNNVMISSKTVYDAKLRLHRPKFNESEIQKQMTQAGFRTTGLDADEKKEDEWRVVLIDFDCSLPLLSSNSLFSSSERTNLEAAQAYSIGCPGTTYRCYFNESDEMQEVLISSLGDLQLSSSDSESTAAALASAPVPPSAESLVDTFWKNFDHFQLALLLCDILRGECIHLHPMEDAMKEWKKYCLDNTAKFKGRIANKDRSLTESLPSLSRFFLFHPFTYETWISTDAKRKDCWPGSLKAQLQNHLAIQHLLHEMTRQRFPLAEEQKSGLKSMPDLAEVEAAFAKALEDSLETVDQKLAKRGLKRRVVKGDGNCNYESFASQLLLHDEEVGGNFLNEQQKEKLQGADRISYMRNEVGSYLQANKEHILKTLVDVDFDEQLQKIRTAQQWDFPLADYVSQTLCAIYKVQLEIIQGGVISAKPYEPFAFEADRPPLGPIITVCGTTTHYDGTEKV